MVGQVGRVSGCYGSSLHGFESVDISQKSIKRRHWEIQTDPSTWFSSNKKNCNDLRIAAANMILCCDRKENLIPFPRTLSPYL